MASSRQKMTLQTLDSNLIARVKSGYNHPPIVIQDATFDDLININKNYQHLNGFSVVPLKFYNCEFNQQVVVGDAHVGKISFDSCIFYSDLSVVSRNSDIWNNCEFKGNVTIEIVEALIKKKSMLKVAKTLTFYGRGYELTI